MKVYDREESLPWGGRKYVWGSVEVVVDLRHVPHTWIVQLPHLCGEWEIGSSVAAVKGFIEDLESAYEFVMTADICNQ